MSFTVDAVYDGTGLRLDAPLDLAPNTKVKVTVEVEANGGQVEESFLDVAESLNLSGPSDWARNIDGYLYGRNDSSR